MSEHTKGPWRARYYDWGYVVSPEAEPSCTIFRATFDEAEPTRERQVADSDLIVAAPRMKAAIERYLATGESDELLPALMYANGDWSE